MIKQFTKYAYYGSDIFIEVSGGHKNEEYRQDGASFITKGTFKIG